MSGIGGLVLDVAIIPNEGAQVFAGVGIPGGVDDVRAITNIPGGFVAQLASGNGLVWSDGPGPREVHFLAAPVGDSGRDLFYKVTPSGVACASCHPEGGDDGRTWHFDPQGARRTKSLVGGVMHRAPFHWDGAAPDFTTLMSDVFVGRMGGTMPDAATLGALGAWLDTLPAPRASPPADDAAVARGRALFVDPQGAGCVTCHAGPHYTLPDLADVGTGGRFRIPSLVGLWARPPYLHDGRAATLADRFAPSGGGDLHGRTSQLSPAQLGDLVAFLATL